MGKIKTEVRAGKFAGSGDRIGCSLECGGFEKIVALADGNLVEGVFRNEFESGEVDFTDFGNAGWVEGVGSVKQERVESNAAALEICQEGWNGEPKFYGGMLG